MRQLYAFTNRNPSLPVQSYDDINDVRVVRNGNNVVGNKKKVIVRRRVNNVANNRTITNADYVETDNVYLNEAGRCPYCRFPWWVWLLLALGLLSLLGLALGLGLGLGLRTRTSSCGNCPANSQCISNLC